MSNNEPQNTPDLINLMEWNQFAEDRKTLLEALTILNNRHRTIVAELNQRLIDRQESNQDQLIRIEDGWRKKLRESQDFAKGLMDGYLKASGELQAKIGEQAAQIVSLREQLGSFVAQYGCSCGHPACRDCWRTNDAKEALSTPAPPVVPLENVRPLVEALRNAIELAETNDGEFETADLSTASLHKILEEFTAKHPQP